MKSVVLWGMFVIGVLAPNSAMADLASCETFNLMRFNPAELERCIQDLKSKQQILEIQNRTLETTVCTLALLTANTRQSGSPRNADLDGFIKATCPLPKPKKK